MYIFCSKALADALNIKKNELQKMPADAQMDDLYAWHGHITKLNGKNTIILMNDRTMYSLIFRNKLPRSAEKFAELIKEAILYTMEVGGFNNPEIDKYMSGVGKIIFAEKADRQMTGNLTRMFLDMEYTCDRWQENESVQADIIFRQAQKLKQLIADLNLTSKLEYAMQPLKLEKLDILELIRQVVIDFLNNGWDEKYKIEFENEMVKDQIPVYWGDASLLKRMFTNLVQNSILHNPNGCNIKLILAETKEAYHFIISDNGIGILEEKRNQLNQGIDFTDSYLENGENVHGFGLKLIRQIVKAHEGQIFFEKMRRMDCA